MTIKAIETIYPWPHGNHYRSRMEARFAVFLDCLKIPFKYEEQGYDLGDGVWYLPDFWLPTYQFFVEIKARERVDDTDIVKTALLAQRSGHAVFVCEYTDQNIVAYIPGTLQDTGWWGQCPLCGALGFLDVRYDENAAPPDLTPFWCPRCSQNKNIKIKREHISKVLTTQLAHCHAAARQHRFEHRAK